MFRNLLPFFAPDEPGASPGAGTGGEASASGEASSGDGESLLSSASEGAGDPTPGEGEGQAAAGEAKAEGEGEQKAAGAPEEYVDFSAPEGLKLDDAVMGDFKALAREMDLTQEQAQKLLEFGGDKLKAQIEAPYQLWRDTQVKWQQEVKADSEIGGANYDVSIRAAGEVFKPGPGNPLVKNEADAQALRQALNVTGAGNNPAVVKFFVRLGKVISEPASFVGNAPKNMQADLLKQLYPSMVREE